MGERVRVRGKKILILLPSVKTLVRYQPLI
jgi:hypothetical protein